MFSLRPYYLRNVHDNVEVTFLGLIVDGSTCYEIVQLFAYIFCFLSISD